MGRTTDPAPTGGSSQDARSHTALTADTGKTVLIGEYVTKPKGGDVRPLFLAFDVLYLDGDPVYQKYDLAERIEKMKGFVNELKKGKDCIRHQADDAHRERRDE